MSTTNADLVKSALDTDRFDLDALPGIWFGSVCVLGLVLRLACTTGLVASDDLGYSHYAQQIAQGLYVPELHHYAIRYGLTLPVAAVYWLLGVREWTTILVPLSASVASVPLLMAIGWKLFGFRAGLIAGVLYATFPAQLRYATILIPEPVAEFYILVAILVYLHARDRHALLLGLAAGICVGVAYLTKEPTLFVAPALMIDAAARRHGRAILGIGLGLAIVVTVEHLYYVVLVGDLLFRPHAMVLHQQSPMVLDANANLFKRLAFAYPYMMLRPSVAFGLHSILALAFIMPGWVFLPRKKFYLLMLLALLPWLYLNFGSSSLSSYIALPVAPRYIQFIYPPLFLMTGAVIAHYATAKKEVVPLAILVIGFVAVVGFASGLATRGQGWRADEVAVLRIIAQRAKTEQVSGIHFAPEASARWRRAMTILAPALRSSPDPQGDELVVRPDALGLPSVAPPVLREDGDRNEPSSALR